MNVIRKDVSLNEYDVLTFPEAYVELEKLREGDVPPPDVLNTLFGMGITIQGKDYVFYGVEPYRHKVKRTNLYRLRKQREKYNAVQLSFMLDCSTLRIRRIYHRHFSSPYPDYFSWEQTERIIKDVTGVTTLIEKFQVRVTK